MKTLIQILFLLLIFNTLLAKSSIDSIGFSNEKATEKLISHTKRINKQLKKAEGKYLRIFRNTEKSMQNAVCNKDAELSDILFMYSFDSNLQLRKKIYKPRDKFPILDELREWNKVHDSTLEAEIDFLEFKLKHIDCIQQYLRNRKKQLSGTRTISISAKVKFNRFDKNVYYFKARVEELKTDYKIECNKIIESKEERQRKLFDKKGFPMRPLDSLNIDKGKELQSENLNIQIPKETLEVPTLKDIDMSSVSNPDIPDLSKPNIKIDPPPTKLEIENMLDANANKFGVNSKDVLQSRMKEMNNKMLVLKNKFPGISSAADVPKTRVNPYKIKLFKNRIEYGWNCQTDQNRVWQFEGMTVAAEAGFKYSPQCVIGAGLSYSLKIAPYFKRISDKGFQGRLFVDYKIRKSLWVTTVAQPSSNLILTNNTESLNTVNKENLAQVFVGIKLKAKKFLKHGPEIQLLYQLIPKRNNNAPIIYRIGWK